ncbi:MAG TPA: hypothetical protein VNR65_01340, partial [Geobacterales bacterium]|nr:hypothetical protein [Geobacterales bacterium]
MSAEPRVPLPPISAQKFSTVCQFCIVGCGYTVYKWPVGKDGGPNPADNAARINFNRPQPPLTGEWISPLM